MACSESNLSLNIALFGYGKMGKLVESLATSQGHSIVAIKQKSGFKGDVEACDAIIDFSDPSCVCEHIDLAVKLNKSIILGTTGWEDKTLEIRRMVEEKKGSLISSPNFSLGIYFFSKIVQEAARLSQQFSQYEVQGLEAHHNKKVDAPSGTAKWLSSLFPAKLPLTSLRIGHVRGQHTILFEGPSDAISLSHTAYCRDDFANGAISAAAWIQGKKGFFTLDDMFKN